MAFYKIAKLGVLTKSGKTLGVRSFYSGDLNMMSEHDHHVSLSGCETLADWHLTVRLTYPTPWQTILLY
jgi:hypothetical protein